MAPRRLRKRRLANRHPSPLELSNPMHLLHVIGSLSPADGGPPEVTRQLMRAYPEIGDSMEVLCLDPPDAPFLSDVSCPVHALGPGRLGRFALSRRLTAWLQKNILRFDGIVMQGLWTFPGVAVRRASLSFGVPYCVFAHGALDPWFNQRYPLKHLKKRLYWPIQHPVLRDAQALFFTSAPELELAKKSFSPSHWTAALFPNGIHEPQGDPAAEIEAFYASAPALRSRRFLLFLGRIQQKKGCDILIEAFARVAAAAPDLDIVMAGPDQVGWQSTLQSRAEALGLSTRIHWPGMLGGKLKWGALRAADAFILPSHQENFCIAMVESLAARRPVLITNQINTWSIIERSGAGLVEEDTLPGIERLLRRWIDMPPAEREAMVARTYPCFLESFTLRRGALAIHSVFATPSAQIATARTSAAV